jgi:hypothetical protein
MYCGLFQIFKFQAREKPLNVKLLKTNSFSALIRNVENIYFNQCFKLQ